MYGLISEGYLMHYGVKGMKWGVRHDLKTVGRRAKSSYSNAKNHVKNGYKSVSKTIKNRNNNLTPQQLAERERRKAIAKKVAIGVGIVVAAGLVVAAAKPTGDIGVMYGKRFINQGADELSTMPISELGNQDLVLEKGKTTLQRLTKDSLEAESAKDIVYATHTRNDTNIYKGYFGITNAPHSIGDKRKIQIQTRGVVSDIKGPSERRRVMYFMQEINANPEFKAAFERDLARKYKRKIKVDSSHSRKYYSDFLNCFGEAKSESRDMYIAKLARHGYNMLPDDNDRGWMGTSPVILLDAANTTVITGQRAKRKSDTVNGILKANSFMIHEGLSKWEQILIT